MPPEQASVTAVGNPAAASCANVGPESTAISAPGSTSRASSVISRPLPASIPLAHSTRSRGTAWSWPSTAPRNCAGTTASSVAIPARSPIRLVARTAFDSRAPGRYVALVFQPLISVDDLALARPQQHRGAVARDDLRERGAPGAGAQHADTLALRAGHAFTPAPRTGSAAASSGQRGRAGVSSGSVWPSASRSMPAHAIIAALSVHSGSGGATKRSP